MEKEPPSGETREEVETKTQEKEKVPEMPWEREIRLERKRLLEEYGEKMPLDEETREKIERFLREEMDKANIDFAKEWFKENRDLLASKGYNVASKDESYILRVANEMNAWESLSEEKYSDFKERLDEIGICLHETKRREIFIDSAHLILNRIYHQREELESQLQKEKKKPPESQDQTRIEFLQNQIKERNEVMEKLVNFLSGRNIREEAEKKRPLESKENFTQRRFEEEFRSITSYLDYLGWSRDREKRGFLKKVWVLRERDSGKLIGEFKTFEETIDFLDNEAKKKAKEKVEKEWEELKQKREKEIQEEIEGEIKKYATSPEKAIEGIKEAYKKIRERLEKEALKLAKAPSEEKGKERVETFEGREVDIYDLLERLSKLHERAERLEHEKLTQEIEKLVGEIAQKVFPQEREILPEGKKETKAEEAKPKEVISEREKFLEKAKKEIKEKLEKWFKEHLSFEKFITLFFKLLFLWQWKLIAIVVREAGFKKEAREIEKRIAKIEGRKPPKEEKEEGGE
jgi:cob(I)alamin adenosyltransferase